MIIIRKPVPQNNSPKPDVEQKELTSSENIKTDTKKDGVIFSNDKTTITINDFIQTPNYSINLNRVGKDRLDIYLGDQSVSLRVPEWSDESRKQYQQKVKTIRELSKNINRAINKCNKSEYTNNYKKLLSLNNSLQDNQLAMGAKEVQLWQTIRTLSKDEQNRPNSTKLAKRLAQNA